MVKRIIFVACLLMSISACAHQVISETTMSAVDKRISFTALQQRSDVYRGRVVLLGGQILATTLEDDVTWIEVLQKHLDRQQRPEDTYQSLGRFLVRFPGFIDPAIYARGRYLTVAGRVDGNVIRPVNDMDYTYPVLTAREHYLWNPDDDRRLPRLGIGVSGRTGSGGGGRGGVGVGVGF
jgi:outer membrane lipoprotein